MNQQHRVGLARWLPILDWGRRYNGKWLGEDLLAAVIVALMLIPQALAYAMLAGLPPVVGLYASLVPLVVYTLLGTSTTLSVGPMAVVSLMTASALSQVAESGSQDYIACLLYTSPSPRDKRQSRMPSSA